MRCVVITKKEHAEALAKIAESIVNGNRSNLEESMNALSNNLFEAIIEFFKAAIIIKHIYSLECLEQEDQTLLGKEVKKHKDFLKRYPDTDSFKSLTDISDALQEISKISVHAAKILNRNIDKIEDIRDRLEIIEINNIILQYDESLRKQL